MDHLLTPKYSTLPPTRVPYVCTRSDQPYDCKDFLTYPNRAEWPRMLRSREQSSPLIIEAEQPSDDRKLEAFFQSWIFFGLLHEVLGPEGLYDFHDYVGHDIEGAYVHTKRLMGNLKFWITAAQGWDLSKQKEVNEHLRECLYLAAESLSVLPPMPSLDIHPLQGHLDFNQAIKMSLGALCDQIIGTLNQVFDDLPKSRMDPQLFRLCWNTDTKDLLIKNGWCPSDIAHISNYSVSLPGHYFLHRLKKPNLGSGHLHCSDNKCEEATIDIKNYKPSHINQQCECELIGPSTDKVAHCLELNTFPVMRLCNLDVDSTSLEVIPFAQGVSYVALSHVWADGLGNPREMKLPRCQLLQLRDLVESLDLKNATETEVGSHEKPELLLWCDTVCVPVVDPECPTDNAQRLKRLGLAQMRNVYIQAQHVLVLDQGLRNVSVQEVGLEEAAIRILISRWMRRLWTFQEGALARSLLFQYADRTVDVFEILKFAKDWHMSSTTGPGFGALLFVTFEGFRGLLRVSYDRPATLQTASRGIAGRSVSVATDEPLCLATILNLDLDRLLSLPDSYRMQELWQMMPSVPGGIPRATVFNTSPRLPQAGFRWAPSTLMGDKDAVIFHGAQYHDNPKLKGIPREHGLQVRFPAWRLRTGVLPDGLTASEWTWLKAEPMMTSVPGVGWFAFLQGQSQGLFDTQISIWTALTSSVEDRIIIFDNIQSEAFKVSAEEVADSSRRVLLTTKRSSDPIDRRLRSVMVASMAPTKDSQAFIWQICYEVAVELRQTHQSEVLAGRGQLPEELIARMLAFTIELMKDQDVLNDLSNYTNNRSKDSQQSLLCGTILMFFLGNYFEVVEQFDEDTEWLID